MVLQVCFGGLFWGDQLWIRVSGGLAVLAVLCFFAKTKIYSFFQKLYQDPLFWGFDLETRRRPGGRWFWPFFED